MGCSVSSSSKVEVEVESERFEMQDETPTLRPPMESNTVASAPSIIRISEKTNGRISWRKGDLIGTGANGRVYLGLEEDTGAIIAAKEIMFTNTEQDLDELAQMQEEIELLRSLHHPNIVTYLGTDVCDDNQTLYIFTEWVPGGSIQALVTKFGRLSEAIVRKYLAQLLVGLVYLHGQQVIHRDIKAANILVDDRGTIKLADFGSSKRMDSMGTMGNENHSLRGTPYFMAPEVIMQTGHGRKADIWSVGCTILQMVTGQPPWKSLQLGTPAALMFHIANAQAPPPMPSALSKQLRFLLLATFSRDLNRRPMADELLQYPFVMANGAAAEANAAGIQGLLERQNAPPIVPQRETIASLLSQAPRVTKQISAIEEAADQTLARQATGLLSDDSDGAKGFQLESFRMPPSEDSSEAMLIQELPQFIDHSSEVPAKVTRREEFTGLESVDSEHSLQHKDRDEALVTMFISKEAAAQFAGADKHFPGRPPTARPRGAPPPRSARSGQGRASIRDFTATLPARPSNRDRPTGNSSGYCEGKSPLLMAHLPQRKHQNFLRDGGSASVSSRNFGNSTYCNGSSSSFNVPCRVLSGKSHRPSRDTPPVDTQDIWPHGTVPTQPRPLAWGAPPPEHNHDERPIVTEAARRERNAEIESAKQKAALDKQRILKNEQFQRELETFKLENSSDV